MKTKKQEAIRKAYVEYADIALGLCDDNGWIEQFDYFDYFPQDNEEKRMHGKLYCRPKALAGIENNNGWIAIESEQDLPKDNGYYWVIRAHSDHVHAEYFYGGFTNYDGYRVTHYQPIIKPLPHIY